MRVAVYPFAAFKYAQTPVRCLMSQRAGFATAGVLDAARGRHSIRNFP
jgi:hypothetical protein